MSTVELSNGTTEEFELEVVAWLENGDALIWMHHKGISYILEANCTLKAFDEACDRIESLADAKITKSFPTPIKRKRDPSTAS